MKNQLRIQKKGGSLAHTCVFTGYSQDVPYLTYDSNHKGVIDGINRQHINLYGTCDICNKKVLVAKIHVNKDSVLYGHDKL